MARIHNVVTLDVAAFITADPTRCSFPTTTTYEHQYQNEPADYTQPARPGDYQQAYGRHRLSAGPRSRPARQGTSPLLPHRRRLTRVLQVAVITGGTGGIGYEVSKALALAGCRVVALSRKQEHGDETRSSLREAAAKIEGHSGQIDFKFVACDFGELKTVKEVPDSIARDEPRIDIVRLRV